MIDKIFKIVILGPESTGKSILSQALAKHYNTNFVEEYARKYLTERNNQYDKFDLVHLAKVQIELEKEQEKNAKKFLFIDNDFINLKIWMQEVFKEENTFINKLIVTHRYDLYLLCDIDIPWEKELLRNNEHNREYLFKRFEEELQNHQLPYLKISGIGDARIKNAINTIDLFFS